MPRTKDKKMPKAKQDSFEETAKRIGCDDSEEKFNRSLRTIAKQRPQHATPKSR